MIPEFEELLIGIFELIQILACIYDNGCNH